MGKPLTGIWECARHREGDCRFDLRALPYEPAPFAKLCTCCEPPEMSTHILTVWIGATGTEWYICGKNAALMLREEE